MFQKNNWNMTRLRWMKIDESTIIPSYGGFRKILCFSILIYLKYFFLAKYIFVLGCLTSLPEYLVKHVAMYDQERCLATNEIVLQDFNKNFPEEDLKNFKILILSEIISSFIQIINHEMETNEQKWLEQSEEVKVYCETLKNYESVLDLNKTLKQPITIPSDSMKELLEKIWQMKWFQASFLQLQDVAGNLS